MLRRALACDMVIAAEDAKFGQPEIRVRIMPGAGGTQRLLRAAGRYKTLLWSLTGDMIPAGDAYMANVVSELVPPGQALTRAIELGKQIAAMPPLAVQAIRDAVRLGADVPIDTALALERRYFERLFDREDQKEGMRAFLEKRAAVSGALNSLRRRAGLPDDLGPLGGLTADQRAEGLGATEGGLDAEARQLCA